MHTLADRGPLTGKQIQQARNEIRLATTFPAHLAERGRTLADCTQADVDAWYAGGYTARRLTDAFLRRAMRSKHMPTVAIPHRSTSNPTPLTQHPRLALLRQTTNRDNIPLQNRVAASLVLLYAQPLARIAWLTIDDVLDKDGDVPIRLCDPHAPVPEPFAGMLLAHLDQRPNTMTVTNPNARWLFPGRRAGQPMPPTPPKSVSATWTSPPSEDACRRSATSCSRPPHLWSPACSATTTTPPLSSPPRPEVTAGPRRLRRRDMESIRPSEPAANGDSLAR
ncbi:hypothetical protein ACWGCW_29440 [Streptomyces sp. NPDC054933]